ncbi:histidine kinase, partial [Escherichia coli]
MGGTGAPRSCYGVQVLVAGRRKQWRDEINGQIRRAGYSAISVDSAVDALTVLVLGLPVDVLVTDAE